MKKTIRFLLDVLGIKQIFEKESKTTKTDINLIPDSETPNVILMTKEVYKNHSLESLNNLYFEILEKLLFAKKTNNISELLMHSQASLALIEPLIKYNLETYGSFKIKSIPAIEEGLIYFSINGSVGQLKNIEELVNHFKELHFYKDDVKLAFIRRKIASDIYKYVKHNSNCLQSDLKSGIDYKDVRFISQTVKYMEKAGSLIVSKLDNRAILNIKSKAGF